MKKRLKSSMVSKDFFLCADGVLVRDGKILFLKRNVEPFKGYWGLVGGHVEDNEPVKDALKREFKEETNLDVEVNKLIGHREEESPDRIKIILTFQVTLLHGKIKVNSESQDYGWFVNPPANSVYDYDQYISRLRRK